MKRLRIMFLFMAVLLITSACTGEVSDHISQISQEDEMKLIEELNLPIDLENFTPERLYGDFDGDKNMDLIYYSSDALFFIKVVGDKYSLVENDFDWMNFLDLYNPYYKIPKEPDAFKSLGNGAFSIRLENPEGTGIFNFKKNLYMGQYLENENRIETLDVLCLSDNSEDPSLQPAEKKD